MAHAHALARPTLPLFPGFYFLHYLQTVVGGPSRFEDFFKAYIKAFSFKTTSSEEFKASQGRAGARGEGGEGPGGCLLRRFGPFLRTVRV